MGAELRLGSCVRVSKTCLLHQMSHSFIFSFLFFRYLLRVSYVSGLMLSIWEICYIGFCRHLGERNALEHFEQ